MAILSRLVVCLAFAMVADHAALSQFELRSQSTVEFYPYALAVGDFNHDGKLDLAVASTCCPSGGVSVLLGNGDGTFAKAADYAAGASPVSIAVADFNHDGNLDLAVASQSGYIAILLGNGDGTFQSATETPPVLTFETYIGVGDFNNDGIPDLIALAPGGAGEISVLLGNGDGTFQSAVTTQPPFATQAMSFGDFNRDGILDLVTAGVFGTGSEVNILLGNGDGTFRQGASYEGDNSPVSIAVADFNGDHKLDFAIANFEGVGIGVWLGRGDGTFEQGVNYATAFPMSVAAARLNGGNMDLVAANFGAPGAGASVLMGNGDGTFQAAMFYPAGYESRFVAVGDFNGDRKPDLALVGTRFDYANVLLNTGVVSFSPTIPLDFKKQAVGSTSAPQTVTLTNTGTEELKIASIKASAQFGMKSTCGKVISAGAKCTISATFSPTKKGGAQGTISIIDSASTKPQVIELLGTGT